jgi:peptidoglycan-associated lipoprotein
MNVVAASNSRAVLARLLALSAVALVGCARVKPEELSVELAKLREEMRTEIQNGDQKVATDLGARVDGLDARLTTLANELDELSREFDVTVERMDQALRFNAPVFFTFDDATIREADQPVLDRFAAVIKSHYPEVLITAEGFTDRAGSAAYNLTLGMRRAEAVIGYLASQGLSQDRLRAVTYGEETERLMDADRGPGEAGHRNRRVVLVIEGTGAPAATTTTTETDGAL